MDTMQILSDVLLIVVGVCVFVIVFHLLYTFCMNVIQAFKDSNNDT